MPNLFEVFMKKIIAVAIAAAFCSITTKSSAVVAVEPFVPYYVTFDFTPLQNNVGPGNSDYQTVSSISFTPGNENLIITDPSESLAAGGSIYSYDIYTPDYDFTPGSSSVSGSAAWSADYGNTVAGDSLESADLTFSGGGWTATIDSTDGLIYTLSWESQNDPSLNGLVSNAGGDPVPDSGSTAYLLGLVVVTLVAARKFPLTRVRA